MQEIVNKILSTDDRFTIILYNTHECDVHYSHFKLFKLIERFGHVFVSQENSAFPITLENLHVIIYNALEDSQKRTEEILKLSTNIVKELNI